MAHGSLGLDATNGRGKQSKSGRSKAAAEHAARGYVGSAVTDLPAAAVRAFVFVLVSPASERQMAAPDASNLIRTCRAQWLLRSATHRFTYCVTHSYYRARLSKNRHRVQRGKQHTVLKRDRDEIQAGGRHRHRTLRL